MFIEVVDTYIIGQVQLRFLWHPEVDDIKLMEFDDCHLVSYCSDECQREYWPQHEETFEKREAEFRDELLFKQPEGTHMGDCPICCLPLSFDRSKSIMYECCSKIICNGCNYAKFKREIAMRLQHTCPFCRKSATLLDVNEEIYKRSMKRIEANDPDAICKYGAEQYEKGDYRSAFQYYTKAAELGDAEAHYYLSLLYRDGEGVEKDEEKRIHHLEEAAIAGNPRARYNLGAYEWGKDSAERAVKHYIIAATQGHDDAIKKLMKCFKEGFVEKDILDVTLRAHKAAVDATKSPQRKEAEEFENRRRRRRLDNLISNIICAA